jgi:hypothetical protein
MDAGRMTARHTVFDGVTAVALIKGIFGAA